MFFFTSQTRVSSNYGYVQGCDMECVYSVICCAVEMPQRDKMLKFYVFIWCTLWLRNCKVNAVFCTSQMYVNNRRLRDPAMAISLAGIMTKICACVGSLLLVAAMVTGITSWQNQNVNINACSLAEVEVNVKLLNNLCNTKYAWNMRSVIFIDFALS
jgi:hypothetical protein